MAALAMIVCVISYVRAKQSGSFGLFATSLALALFASLSKETGATVVLLMLLLEVLPFEEEKEVEKESTATKTTAAAPALRVCATVCATAAFFFVRVRMHGGHSLRKWQLMENHVAMMLKKTERKPCKTVRKQPQTI